MAKRRVTTFKLDEEVQSKLLRANMKTVEDVLSHSILHLMSLLRLSSDEVEHLIACISSACLPQLHTAYDLLELENKNGIKLGDPDLDIILHGGVREGALTELTGPPGVGKTQLCLHLALNCLERQDSRVNGVYCVDTEGAFRLERLVQMIHLSCKEVQDVETRFHISKPSTVQELTQIMDSMELLCVEEDVGLLVVDSVASLVQKEFSTESGFARAALLASWAARFKAIADRLKIAVLVTNHVTSRRSHDDDDEDDDDDHQEVDETGAKGDGESAKPFSVNAALGNTWTHFVNTRFILQFGGDGQRELVIAKSPVAPVAAKKYVISASGVQFFGPLRNKHRKGMNPVQSHIGVQPACTHLKENQSANTSSYSFNYKRTGNPTEVTIYENVGV